MRRKKRRAAAFAAVLAAVLLLSPIARAAETGDELTGPAIEASVETDKRAAFTEETQEEKCSLTVYPVGEGYDADFKKDLATVNLTLDLYKVADAVKDEKYDTYSYTFTDKYKNLNGYEEDLDQEKLETMESSAWVSLAASAAAATLDPDSGEAKASIATAGSASYTGSSDGSVPSGEIVFGTIENLDPGLYLAVARGTGLGKYVSTNDNSEIITLADSDLYTYSFLPELIALPSTATNGKIPVNVDEDGNRITGDDGKVIKTSDGEWVFNLTAILKPSRVERYGSIKIIKKLETYESSQPATFVFQVDAWKDENKKEDERVYSNVISITFGGSGEESYIIEDKIPAGSYVVIQEVYSGITYELDGSQNPQTIVAVKADGAPDAAGNVEVPGENTVTFTNKYDETGKTGGSITNVFTFEATGVEGVATSTGSWSFTKSVTDGTENAANDNSDTSGDGDDTSADNGEGG